MNGKQKRKERQHKSIAVEAASRDFSGLLNGAKGIAQEANR
jgi:hypothetical protein